MKSQNAGNVLRQLQPSYEELETALIEAARQFCYRGIEDTFSYRKLYHLRMTRKTWTTEKEITLRRNIDRFLRNHFDTVLSVEEAFSKGDL